MNTEAEMFTPAQVAEAAGVVRTRLTSWIERDFPRMEPGEAPGPGGRREVSRNRARQLILAARLIRWGVPVKQAGRLSLEFTDLADEGKAYILGTEPPAARMPGDLFGDDATVFRVGFFPDGEARASVDRLADVAGHRKFTFGPSLVAHEVLTIDLNQFIARTDRALAGLQPNPESADHPEAQTWVNEG